MKPSVSKLLSLLDKPALLSWANRIGLQGIELSEYRKKALTEGTSIHKQIEDYIKIKKPFDDIINQNAFDKYFSNKVIIDYEKKIETDWFIGRLDIKFEYKGKIYVCDFKSNQKNVYLENKLQLVAYRMSENADGIGVISVPDFKFLPIQIKDYTPYEEILKSLSNIYKFKTHIEYGNKIV